MKKSHSRKVAVVGAGIAGLAFARTMAQAGWEVTVFEQSAQVGGRMAAHDTEMGLFDLGTQYFTAKDPRFTQVLAQSPLLCQRWDAAAVPADPSAPVALWVACPSMGALAQHWAAPLIAKGCLHLNTSVHRIELDPKVSGQWQVVSQACTPAGTLPETVWAGFDQVVMATPARVAHAVLSRSAPHMGHAKRGVKSMLGALAQVEVAPCWSVGLAFALATDPALRFGPSWSAARPQHKRVAWIARELSKPGRTGVERWVVQATPEWSLEHYNDSAQRVEDKLVKAFSELTGIRTTPTLVTSQRWQDAKTIHPMGTPYRWQAASGIGLCGDYCKGYRVEDAFLSGLELALHIHQHPH